MSDTSDLLKSIRKKYGDNSIFTLDDFLGEKVSAISTGLIDVDIKSGIGGIPIGRATEIYGSEASGKSTLCYSIVASAQKMGLLCGYVDTEQCLDLEFANKCGVNPNNLVISQPDNLNVALGVAEDLVRNGNVKLVIFDSLVGLGTEKENEDDFGSVNYGGAKLNFQWFRRNMYHIRENGVAMVFTNQVRDKIGAFFQTYDTPGGHALKHFSSIKIMTSKVKDIKIGEEIVGVECTAAFKKNKVAPPSKVANFSIYFEKGIWRAYDLLTNLIDYGIITMRGSYIVYNEQTIAQGKQAAASAIENDPKLEAELREEISKVIK